MRRRSSTPWVRPSIVRNGMNESLFIIGLDAATEALRWGVNDLGGTLMEESISRPAVERTTLYELHRHAPLPEVVA